ncbi:MAG: OmpW family outer membrane protein [Motiliproteus sp.]
MKKAILCAAITAAIVTSPIAHAYEAGDILVRAGITNVAPNDSSGKVYVDGSATPYEVSVDSDTQLGLNLVYFYNQNWAVEVLAATPFSHGINLQNAGVADGPLAEVSHLPPTISALYFFNGGNNSFQPYAGVGINYTAFFDEEFTADRTAAGFSDLKLDDSWGLAAQLGFDYQLNERWLINASVRYIDISTTANFKVGGADSSVDVDIDPFVTSLMVGYKF